MTWRLLRLVLVPILLGAAFAGRTFWRRHRYDRLIRFAAAQYQIDPLLVRAVVRRESGFRPSVRGAAGEYGLMQVREAAGREWAAAERIPNFDSQHLENPLTNLLAGAWYLARARSRWYDRDDPDPFALAEYNAGRSNALRWAAAAPDRSATGFIETITFPRTRDYIQDVLRHSRPVP